MVASPRKAGTRRRSWIARLVAVTGILAVWLVPGRAPATVEEQRARLPPPARCEDPVAGVWKSHKYDPRYGDWYQFTLTIDRSEKDPERLVGTIRSHSWRGGPAQEEPPPCRPGGFHWAVHMTAEGRAAEGGRIAFGGTSWRPEAAWCGRAPGPGEYNLDHFSGVIDPEIQEFQSVNNDGGRSVNDPMVFRRVACHESPPAPHVQTAPPDFYPERGGCLPF